MVHKGRSHKGQIPGLIRALMPTGQAMAGLLKANSRRYSKSTIGWSRLSKSRTNWSAWRTAGFIDEPSLVPSPD
jgi:hypothetical protein